MGWYIRYSLTLIRTAGYKAIDCANTIFHIVLFGKRLEKCFGFASFISKWWMNGMKLKWETMKLHQIQRWPFISFRMPFLKPFSLKLVSFFFHISDGFIPYMHSSMPFIRHMFGGFSKSNKFHPNEIARHENHSHSILIWICFNWILWAKDELTTIHCSQFSNCIRRKNAIDERLHFSIYLYIFSSNISILIQSLSI